jgi:nucleotide-binding universal stress UspA family protein
METNLSKGRIVVGIDGSPTSQQALLWAATEARRRDSGLDVLHGWLPPVELYPSNLYLDPTAFHDKAKAILDKAVESVAAGEGSPLDVRPLLLEGAAAVSLVDAASHAELLVVGSRGRGGFTGLLLGSVSRECAHRARCPVVVVPASWAGDETGRIVVGVDGSEPAYTALHWAIAEAAMRHCRLDVVNAYSLPPPVLRAGPLAEDDQEVFEKSSRALLDEMVAPALGAADLQPASVEMIPACDQPAAGLLAVAHGADLLVVGSRGRGDFRGLLLGSVSQQCVLHAACPVAIFRGEERTKRTAEA